MRNKKNMRTCLGCHKVLDKTNFFRIANIKQENKVDEEKTSQEKRTIILDLNQNMGGRGAYICSITCFEEALKKKFLQKRLRASLSNEEQNILREAINKFKR